jgi:hypothetical protein
MSTLDRMILFVSIGITVAIPVDVRAASPVFDALVLAIQHFDPDHNIGIEAYGQEVEFMRDALWAARTAVPEIASFHISVDNSVTNSDGPAMFRSLHAQLPNFGPGDVAQLRTIAESIGLGCIYEKTVVTNLTPRTLETTVWQFDAVGEAYKDRGRLCTNTDLVDWLCSRNVRAIILRTSQYKHSVRGDLYLTFGTIGDLKFRAKQLMADSSYENLFGELVLRPFTGNLVGAGQGISVVPGSGLVGYEGVRLKFWTGWGDCPSGCISRHYWVVDIKTVSRVGSDEVNLAATLVEEYGDKIHEAQRKLLRNPPVAR